jgi:cytidyltransferase-like protein
MKLPKIRCQKRLADRAALLRWRFSLAGKLVVTNGCFDILHAGHVQFLRQARSLGDKLLVISDRSEELATTYKDMGIDDVMKLG